MFISLTHLTLASAMIFDSQLYAMFIRVFARDLFINKYETFFLKKMKNEK
jgi:hypothetical protein